MKFWNVSKTKSNSGKLILHGAISDSSWWDDEVTPKQFANDLAGLGEVSEINVHINSKGGDVFAGLTIYQMLKQHAAKVTVHVDGLAASIASIIAMAGDRIVMPKGAMMMIHNPWTSVWGADANGLRNTANVLDKIRDSLVEVYSARTGKTSEELIALMDAETWMTSSEAVSLGFATEHEQSTPISAMMHGGLAVFNGIGFDLSGFARPPRLPEAPEQPVAAYAPVPAATQLQNKGGDQPVLTVESLKNQYPDIFNAVLKQGAEQERTRMQALDDLAGPGRQALLNKAKYETMASAADTAMEIVKAEGQKMTQMMKKMKNDADESGIQDVESEAPDKKSGDEAEETAQALAGIMNKRGGGR
ncbi:MULTISPECIES: head maturation protease, ClpP-related [Paenibacillus]|uniref:head maturation protease, ClpP-related n=1 Tax=Paenibacillus TaxID=44249 RepID=UPI0022B892BC|nr:head maturation protease, ClpP-related [Paenibacillus caseinilyticus]MCZ8520135.1 Clp protease ClpP [Paenibacillus caseinilyticus]